MSLITLEQLKQILPNAQLKDLQNSIVGLNEAMVKFNINTKLRIAAFIANVGHENGNFLYKKEIWGPTKQQLRYERDFSQPWTKDDLRNKLAFILGNDQLGDGKKYMGRGDIQTTGKANYAQISKDLGIDFVNNPQWLETPKYKSLSAGWFWNSRGLNSLADKGEFIAIVEKINGGINGLEERLANYNRALTILK